MPGSISITYDQDGRARSAIRVNYAKQKDRVIGALRVAANRGARQIVSRGRLDIASAGNYGASWQQGLSANVTDASGKFTITVKHNHPGYGFLNKGGVIKGKPLLWIPLSDAEDAHGLGSPRNYPGRLVQATSRAGNPILINPDQKEVKYVGKTQVTIARKFHILDIIRQVSIEIKSYYNEAVKSSQR